MRAAVLYDSPGRLEIETLSIDKPASDEVLIRIAASGLCHTALHSMEGHLATALPTVLGHEAAGIVEAAGENVSYVGPGDYIVACLSVFCGRCEHCLSGHPSICANPQMTDRAKDTVPRISLSGHFVAQFM